MNNVPQIKKSRLHILAGIIFLINALSFAVILLLPIIEDGIGKIHLNVILEFVNLAAHIILAVTFLGGIGKGLSATAFGILAASNIVFLVDLFTSGASPKFIFVLPYFLSTLAYIFAIPVCTSGARRAAGSKRTPVWFVPALLALAAGAIDFFVNYFDDVKGVWDIVFKQLKYIEEVKYVIYYIALFIYLFMFVIFPIGILVAMCWASKPSRLGGYAQNPEYNQTQHFASSGAYHYNYGNVNPAPAQPYAPQPQPQPQIQPQPEPEPQPEPAPAERKIKGYDAMTGAPIYEDAPRKINGYDAMTGEPIYED